MMPASICSNPNFAFDRAAGSHLLAAAGQRGRWADNRRAPADENPEAKDPEGSGDRDARPRRGADHADVIQ